MKVVNVKEEEVKALIEKTGKAAPFTFVRGRAQAMLQDGGMSEVSILLKMEDGREEKATGSGCSIVRAAYEAFRGALIPNYSFLHAIQFQDPVTTRERDGVLSMSFHLKLEGDEICVTHSAPQEGEAIIEVMTNAFTWAILSMQKEKASSRS